MENNQNLSKNNECCPKIIVYGEDFYMTFGNCQRKLVNCDCPELNVYKNLLNFIFNKKEREKMFS